MIGDGGPTQFNVAGGGDPFNELLQQVRQAAEGVYDILGEMGRGKSGSVVYLARELESAHLVALKLTRAAEAEYSLEVVRTLDSSVPGLESRCPECKAVLPDWDRFCFHCGADLSAGPPAPGADEAAGLLDAVKEATAGEYEILGQMSRGDGGGAVFFARDKTRGKLVALRLRREDGPDASQGAFSIGETQILRPLAAELGQTQVLGAAPFPAPPEPRPAAPAPRPPAKPRPGVRTLLAQVPKQVLWGSVAGAGVLVLAVVALSGGGESALPPPPPPADTVAGPVVVPDSVLDEPDTVATIVPPAAAAIEPDSGTIRLAVQVPSGAVFTVNGARVRGSSVRLPPGRHTLSLIAAGVQPVTLRVNLQPGQTYRWAPRLAQVVATTPPPAPRPPPPPPPPPTCARAFGRSDWTQASQLCLNEANTGGRDAQRMMGRMRELGNGVPQDRAQAANWYVKAGAAGDAESQRRLGYFYRNGTGVRRDDRESARWFGMAAQQGDPVAQVEYGAAVEEGKGISKSETEAATWYRKAADVGSAAGVRRLGRLYERGRGVQKNEAEAARYYEQAGERGDPEAMYLLGRLYKDGRGVDKSEQLALEWFQKAGALGHRDAAEEARKLERPD